MDRWSATSVHLTAVLSILLVGILDWRTGPHLSVSIFYLLPVSLAAWRLGGRAGIVWSVASAVSWATVERLEVVDLPGAFLYWNAGGRLGFFVVVAAAVASLRRRWETERTLAGTDFVTGVLMSSASSCRRPVRAPPRSRSGRSSSGWPPPWPSATWI